MTDPFVSMSGAEVMVGFVLSFLIGVGVRGLVDWWRLRRSFVRFRMLDELPPDVTFPRVLRSTDPSPSPRRRRVS